MTDQQKKIIDHESVGVIIACPKTSPDFGAFMFQLNDSSHPDPRCHGKLQLWGGRFERVDEGDPMKALRRELREEWRDQGVISGVLRCIENQTPRMFELESSGGTPVPYRYRLYTYLALLPEALFVDWLINLEQAGFNEGLMSTMTRVSVEQHIADPAKSALFLGNQLTALSYYFECDELMRYVPPAVRASQ